jgi:hypothetical protein
MGLNPMPVGRFEEMLNGSPASTLLSRLDTRTWNLPAGRSHA